MPGKLLVCHIVTKLDVGGMENGIINLCNGINRQYFKPVICCLNEKGTMATRLKSDVDIYNIQINQNNKIIENQGFYLPVFHFGNKKPLSTKKSSQKFASMSSF